MIKKQDDVNWDKKDAREYFSKTVNSLLINNKDLITIEKLQDIMKISKAVVDKMFDFWPADKPINLTKLEEDEKAKKEAFGGSDDEANPFNEIE